MILVLPTPVSPIKRGLFFRRLANICDIRSSSSSLPIKGSNSFFFAFSVKFKQNLFSNEFDFFSFFSAVFNFEL